MKPPCCIMHQMLLILATVSAISHVHAYVLVWSESHQLLRLDHPSRTSQPPHFEATIGNNSTNARSSRASTCGLGLLR